MEWICMLILIGIWIFLGLIALGLVYLTKEKEEKVSFGVHFGIIGLGFISLFGILEEIREDWFVS